jgi:tRNA-dihydrouridine synthase B
MFLYVWAFLILMYHIGNVSVRGKLVLAPMFRVSTLPFRVMCHEYGAGLVCSEMLNGNAIERSNKSSLRMAKSVPEERPLSMQLFGTKEDVLLAAAKRLECDMIDLNCGCPEENVMRQGAGAALLKRPNKIGEIVKYLADNLDRPVTAKIRIGLDEKRLNAVEVARIIEEAGAKAIAVHGRTVAQRYSGKADWGMIAKVKEAVSIPVIANGDVVDEKSANECLRVSNADFLMIGRAAMGDPHIFKRIATYLRTGETLPRQARDEKLEDFFRYLELARRYDCLNYPDVKLHAVWLTKGIRGGIEMRRRLSMAKSVEAVEALMAGQKAKD